MSEHRLKKVRWEAWRIIPSRNPPIDLYRRVAPASEWKSIINIELLTNPRVREMREGLGFVRPEDLKGGATQNWNLAPFTYLNPEGTRFSDGSFGTCFLAKEFGAALKESMRLREQFLNRTATPPITLDMRVIRTTVEGAFMVDSNNDFSADERSRKQLWKSRQIEGCDGVFFQLVPGNPHSDCLEVFRPRVLGQSIQGRHLTYRWSGESIDEVYDFDGGKIVDLLYLRTTCQIRYAERAAVGRAQSELRH